MFPKALVLAALALPSLAQLNEQTTPTLNLTAIGASNGESTLECWQLDSPFKLSTGAGTSGALGLFLGDLSNATYTVLPGRFDGGLHRAPAQQFVLFTSGLIHITLPNGTDEAWIQGGKYGLIIAADTADVSTHGHRTRYPSAADTVGIQFPIKPGTKFEYKRLHHGPCREAEMTGL
ncbi:small secreted protein [Purpureocillium lavendulum]|uniref:Small secreted protein n=1 Tax=Purpureocillium lavendulum TaxID=1247861 RepID=A0AB34FWN4_9HYPO|nr:small secreted protein [Purpureocillium lavendulum]